MSEATPERYPTIGEFDGSSTFTGLYRSIPNILSVTRLALGLAFPLIAQNWRAAVVVIAAVTDLADGAASRRWNASSTVGRFLDPIADKVFVIAVLATLLAEGLLGPWEAIGVALRDLVILAGTGWVLIRRDWPAYRQVAPTMLGKITTAAQFVLVLALLINQNQEPLWTLWLATTVISGLAAIDYARLYFSRARENNDETTGSGRNSIA